MSNTKPTENYTLKRFYFEAKAILEKHIPNGKEEYRLSVQFEIEDRDNKVPDLNCFISYRHKDYRSGYQNFYGSASSPAIALQQFEDAVKEYSGKMLIENVSVEI